MKRWMASFFVVTMLLFGFAGVAHAKPPAHVNNENNRKTIELLFKDKDEAAWANEYIGKMRAKNVLSGFPDGTFGPNRPVKRAEVIVATVRLMDLQEGAEKAEGALLFKDAHQIEKHYNWAKGSILVGLKQGLFDTTEDRFQPEKPASRIWVAALLVKALGLEEEALGLMTTIPDFKDAAAIPAGSVGYVNAAVKYGLVNGYPDGTFKPNKNVTRAEMAVLLDKTNENLQEQSGASVVAGTITDLTFAANSNPTVTEQVYARTDGVITLRSYTGETLTYAISSRLAVPYHGRFIQADQLRAGDQVMLVVKDGIVLEAALRDQQADERQPEQDQSVHGILELELELKAKHREFELEYENKRGKQSAEIEIKTKGAKEKSKGAEALKIVQGALAEAQLGPELDRNQLLGRLLDALEINPDDYEKFELEIKFANGKKVEFETKIKGKK